MSDRPLPSDTRQVLAMPDRAGGRFLPGNTVNRRGMGVLARLKQAARDRLGDAEIQQMVTSLVGRAQAGDLQAGIMLFGKATMERGISGVDEEQAVDEKAIKVALLASLRRRLGVEPKPMARIEDDLGAGI